MRALIGITLFVLSFPALSDKPEICSQVNCNISNTARSDRREDISHQPALLSGAVLNKY